MQMRFGIFVYFRLWGISSHAQSENTLMIKDDFKPFLNKKEVKELFKKFPKLKTRKDLRDGKSDPFDYYELPDGKILVVIGFGDTTGTMYRSEAEFKEITNEPDVRKDGEHVLSDLIKDEKIFLANIEAYISKLSKKTNIPLGNLDKSLKSLKVLDSAYKKKRPEKNEFFNKDYLYLIAYLGEVYRNEKGGDWVFRKEEDNESYEPYIQIEAGQLLDTYYELFKECYENFEGFSIFDVAKNGLYISRGSRDKF